MPPESLKTPVWSSFDADWYRARYASELGELAAADSGALEAHYRNEGAARGLSPNKYFDELWYRGAYPDIEEAIRQNGFVSGFDHYSQYGHEDRSPNGLFSEPWYLSRYPDLTRATLDRSGALNGYDHYLRTGDREFRSGSPFFDPQLFYNDSLLAPSPLPDNELHPASSIPETGAFATLLAAPQEADVRRTSWYFDAPWYLETYPAVRKALRDGLFQSALQHFLTNRTPGQFSALPWFSESFYLDLYPDIGEAVAAGNFRSGYEHFVRFGCLERRRPHPEIDLEAYFHSGSVREDIERGLVRDAFAHWISRRETQVQSLPSLDQGEYEHLAACRAEALIALLARRPLDFSFSGTPQLSVVVHVRNRFPQTLAALSALRCTFHKPTELVIVDAGSRDDTARIEQFIIGARVIRLESGATHADAMASALPYLTAQVALWLGQGVQMGHGAVQAALSHFDAVGGSGRKRVGLVTGRAVRPDGRLLEAGAILWRDASLERYLEGAPPETPEACFSREVSCGSTPCLMVDRALLGALNGFDRAYGSPAAAIVDLGLRAAALDAITLYEPEMFASVDIVASEDVTLEASDRATLRSRHAERFLTLPPPAPSLRTRARLGALSRKRILFVEDKVPCRGLGSGFVRSNDIVRAMSRLGHQVTVAPIYSATEPLSKILAEFPSDVEVLNGLELKDFDRLLTERSGVFDCVWVGRTHNLERLAPILLAHAAGLPMNGIVLDTEALDAPRTALRAQLAGEPQSSSVADAVSAELTHAWLCQAVVATSALDASAIRQAGYANVMELGHMQPVRPTPANWTERRDLLFVGAMHETGSPNHDSLVWFIQHVLPLVREASGADIRLTVAGYRGAGVDLSSLGAFPGVELLGAVDDVAPLYASHKIFVAPTRFAGGVPYKVHEAASYGLPVVASDLLCRQLGWRDGLEIVSGPVDDPSRFASRVASLYADEEFWSAVRTGALRALEDENSEKSYTVRLNAILQRVFAASTPQA
ncbi:glycosyl transferase [Acetobacter sp. DsW_063]|nr:glycosyl transferase [Acetobacter sp. DsW_063]